MDAEIKYTDFAHYSTRLTITEARIRLTYDRASAILVKYMTTMSLIAHTYLAIKTLATNA